MSSSTSNVTGWQCHRQDNTSLSFDRCASWTKSLRQNQILNTFARIYIYFSICRNRFWFIEMHWIGWRAACLIWHMQCCAFHIYQIANFHSIWEYIWAVVLQSMVISVLSLWLIFFSPRWYVNSDDHVTADLLNFKFNIAFVCATCLHIRARSVSPQSNVICWLLKNSNRNAIQVN